MVNKIFRTVILLAAFVIVSFNVSAGVPPTQLTKNIMWEITDDGVLKVYGTGAIPDFKKDSNKAWHQRAEKIKGLKHGFKIKSIEIGEGITSIGNYAFMPVYGDVLHDFGNIYLKSIILPSTLQTIGNNAFCKVTAREMTLPEGLKTIGFEAFQYGGKPGSLEIPAGVEQIWSSAFYNSSMDHVVINGDPEIFESAFVSDNLKSIDITGYPQPKIYMDLGIFPWKKKCMVRVYNRDMDLSGFKIRTNIEVVYSTPEEDSVVTSYVANRLMQWDDFLSQKIAEGKLLSIEDEKREIEAKLEAWQVKGEFETMADWKNRVNETTRRNYLNELLSDREKKLNSVKSEYEKLRNKYVDEFYKILIDRETEKFLDDTFTLCQYDADNETYLIQTGHSGDMILRVPREDAPRVKEKWPEHSDNKWTNSDIITPHFIPRDDRSVVLAEVDFNLLPGTTYNYKGEDVSYAVTDVNYNFAPLEIEQLDDSSFASPLVAETPATKTIGGSAISKRKVDVAHNSVTAGSGGAGSTVANKRSDVDVSIPKGDMERPNTFALVIANENYRRVASVPYAINDGTAIQNYLKTTLGVPEKNIFYVEDASLNDINYNLRKISEICEAYKGDASVIVYYAGHGVPDDNTKDAYLLPVDGYAESPSSSGLSLSSLTEKLAELPTQSSVLFLDACFSGGERSSNGTDMLVSARGVRIKPKKNVVSGNLVVMSATQGEESAQPYEEKQHGMFTYFLLKKLRDSKGKVTFGELADYITDNVERTSVVNGRKQTPTINASAGNQTWRSTEF